MPRKLSGRQKSSAEWRAKLTLANKLRQALNLSGGDKTNYNQLHERTDRTTVTNFLLAPNSITAQSIESAMRLILFGE